MAMSEKTAEGLKNTAYIADLFGCSQRRVRQLVAEKIIPAEEMNPYRFDSAKTVRAYVKYLSEKANAKKLKAASMEDLEKEKTIAEVELKQSKAKVARMQAEELEGRMHCSEDVEAMTSDLVYAIRSMVLALPGRLAMDVAKIGDAAEASARIQQECYKVLEELSHYEYDPAEYRKRVQDRQGWSGKIEDDPDG